MAPKVEAGEDGLVMSRGEKKARRSVRWSDGEISIMVARVKGARSKYIIVEVAYYSGSIWRRIG